MKAKTERKSRWKLLHQYYKYTGFYDFIGKSLKKSILPIVGFIGLILFLHYYVIDLRTVLVHFTEEYNAFAILGVFLVSETFLGLLPPEIFIAWSEGTVNPILFLSILAILSYLGGISAYFIGNRISRTPKVSNYIATKMGKYMKQIQKWGAMLIVAGALLPLPFAIVSLASGMVNYKFKHYLLWGLFRLLRFYLYAFAIFKLV